MGTLVNKNETRKKPVSKKSKKDEIDVVESKESLKLKKKIEKEYIKIRRELEDVRQAFDSIESARSIDDINLRLKNLENASKRIRKGGFMSKGASYHSKLLTKYKKLSIE